VRNALRWAAILVAGGAVLAGSASPAQGRLAADQALGDSFVTWTKKLNADFRDLNNTLRTGADSLADYALRVGRLYVIAQRIQEHATAAEKDLQDENATSANALLAKRRALKAFDVMRRSGEQWANYAKCTALGSAIEGGLQASS